MPEQLSSESKALSFFSCIPRRYATAGNFLRIMPFRISFPGSGFPRALFADATTTEDDAKRKLLEGSGALAEDGQQRPPRRSAVDFCARRACRES